MEKTVRKHYASSWFFSVFIVMSATACGDAGTAPASIAGRYNVVTVNGVAVPALLAESPDEGAGVFKAYLDSGYIQVNDGGTCGASISVTYRDPADFVVDTETDTDTCTWTQAGSTITFTHGGSVFWRDGGSSDTATLSGNRLTMTFPHWFGAGTVTLVFER